MKKTILFAVVAMMTAMSAQAQDSAQDNQKSSATERTQMQKNRQNASVGLGIVTISDSVRGIQLSPISNIASNASGVQLSAFSNVAYEGLKGLQISALNNIVIGEANGFQLASFTNQNVGTLKGLQLAFRNKTDTLRGTQIGIFNITRDYDKGVQVGLVNYASDTISKRYGLVNINPKTKIAVMGFAGTNSKANFALRFRNRSTYNIIGAGTHYMGLNDKFSGTVFYRIGQYFDLTPRLSLSGDVGFFHIETFQEHSTEAPERLYSLEARLNLDYQLSKHWGVFGSVGYGDTRYYNHNKSFRHRMIGEVGLTYQYAGYNSQKSRELHLHSEEDMMEGNDNRFALPEKRNMVRTISMITALNAFVNRWDTWVLNEEFSRISFHSIGHNFEHAFVWDNDNFNTNLFAHPYHGNLYFNSARTNGYNFWQSYPCALGGSLMWEFFGEITPPAINDMIATSVGGSCIGEITFRISDLFYDDREVGFSRFLRELGGAAVSPMKGVKRILTGQAWKRKSRNYLYHDYKRIPVKYSISVGSRYLADDHALFRGEHNPYMELAMVYGDAYNNDENKPYDYFRSSVTMGFSSNQPLINRLNLLGRLWGTPISDTDKFEADLGIFQHFNFYNSEAVKDGTDLIPYRISEAASVGPGLIYRFPHLEQRMELEQRIFVSGILLGGSLSDYLYIQERDYNMGSGFSAKIQTRMDIKKVGYMDIDANYFHIFTWKGYDRSQWVGKTGFDLDYTNAQGDPGNTRMMAFNANFGVYLSRHMSLDIRTSYFWRHAHYKAAEFKNVDARTFELRAGLTYKL